MGCVEPGCERPVSKRRKRRIWRERDGWAASVRRRNAFSAVHGLSSWVEAVWYVMPVHQALARRRGRRWADEWRTMSPDNDESPPLQP